MSFAARPHVNAAVAASGLPALGSAVIAASYTLPDTATLTFNTDGTITYFKENFASGPATWYGSTSAGIGASYEIRFTLTSGTAWDAGLTSGTWYSLSSNRAISLTATTVDLQNGVTFDIRLASTGVIQTTGTGGLGVYDEP